MVDSGKTVGMLLEIHISEDEAQALRARLAASPWMPRLHRIVHAYLARENVFTQARRVAPRAAGVTSQLMSPLSHAAASLSLYHAIEPTPVIESVLQNFLLWTLEQKVMLVHGAFLQGLYLRSVILALDAVGESLSKEQRTAILEHLILTAVDNPDASDPVNNRPDKNAPMRRVMEIPGTGFHLKDEHVNNWDLLGSMGVLYVARATDALLPNRDADVNTWTEVARRRVERFFRLQYTDEGEYGEGPSYYSYATQGAVSMLDMLQRWPRGAWWKGLPLNGLMASARWAREVQPREVVHGPFNYNDCSLGVYEAPTVIHW